MSKAFRSRPFTRWMRRAGARTIVATRMAQQWFFLYGFEKNERANISSAELKALQEYAKTLLELDAAQLAAVVSTGEIMEVKP
ncbi:MAG: type II toxin-antitoxin system RelE/ParE family toxin [Rhodocyclaceae bacterium]|nr:type II toxin-antitoxin system RelE/ParE family toxin [Rhodocyclaceae bacterium]